MDFQTAYKMTTQPSILAWLTDKKNPNHYYFNRYNVKKSQLFEVQVWNLNLADCWIGFSCTATELNKDFKILFGEPLLAEVKPNQISLTLILAQAKKESHLLKFSIIHRQSPIFFISYIVLRHPVTNWVTVFTNPYNLTNDLFILKLSIINRSLVNRWCD